MLKYYISVDLSFSEISGQLGKSYIFYILNANYSTPLSQTKAILQTAIFLTLIGLPSLCLM